MRHVLRLRALAAVVASAVVIVAAAVAVASVAAAVVASAVAIAIVAVAADAGNPVALIRANWMISRERAERSVPAFFFLAVDG
ncbi:MAG: hypothetical protein WCI03_10110 [bacterium]